jgi:hypothetical protein
VAAIHSGSMRAFEKLPGYELVHLKTRGICKKFPLYFEQKCLEQFLQYYRSNKAHFEATHMGRPVNVDFRNAVHFPPHFCALLSFAYVIRGFLEPAFSNAPSFQRFSD